jgi:hypothetical protein
MSRPGPDEGAALVLIGAIAVAALILGAYHYGLGEGRPQPVPAKTWTHGVAFKLHSRERLP